MVLLKICKAGERGLPLLLFLCYSKEKAKKLLEKMQLFDIYRNEKLGENKKSVAYSLIFRDKNRTLSDDEINVVMENIISELQKTLKAELRK